jgi:hypothetical protein
LIQPLLLALLSVQSYQYWIEPCDHAETGCQNGDVELAQWAFEAWQNASGGGLQFAKTSDPQRAHIRLYWAGARQGMYGEARPILVDGKPGAEVYVRPAPLEPQDPLLRSAIVYLTCLHETGHALGLPHTADFDDIMYSFQFGGDIPEYFGRYRRKLRNRTDIRENPGMSDADRQHLKERPRAR